MIMKIVYQLSEEQTEGLHELYKNEWWTSSRTYAQTKSCVEGSQIVIGIVDANQLVGFVRVLTDYTFKALIFDLIIKTEYRGQKLAQKLIQLVKEHESLKNVTHFELYCLPELKAFYKQFNFTDELNGIELLRCINDNAAE